MADITKFAQEYSKKKEEELAKRKAEGKYTHDELRAALYWAWDAFDRAGILMLCIGKTGEQVKHNDPLSGDGIDLGVRKLEWISGAKPVLDAFLEHNDIKIETKGNMVIYDYLGIPVRIRVLDPDDDCLFNADTVVYEVETFRIPSPYERFQELYEKTQYIEIPSFEEIAKDFSNSVKNG